MKRLYDWSSFKRTKKRMLEDRLNAMEWELKSRLNSENKYGYMKGVNYYRDQIKKTKKLLGIK